MWREMLILRLMCCVVVIICICGLQPATVWTTFGDLAVKSKAVNLGQGYPDWQPPEFVTDALKASLIHQYTRPAGHPALAEVIAESYTKHLMRSIDPMQEVAITVGATQALYLALISLIRPDDEVLMFDPFFELYQKQIRLVNARPVFVKLRQTDGDAWTIDFDELERAITPRTKILILNSPHNPTGKVFTYDEMQKIAAIVRRHPHVTVLSDEVYKFTVYGGAEPGDSSAVGHYHFARLPDMWDRTITISSCGKTFSVTGWQVGWMVGPAKFIAPIQAVLPCVQFCAASPIQDALSKVIKQAEKPFEGSSSYYAWLQAQFKKKREVLSEGLRNAGLQPLSSQGGFFLMAKLPLLSKQELHVRMGEASMLGSLDEPYDWQYCRLLVKERGVVGIPASPFFSSENNWPPMARFAFCKTDETLREAYNRLSVPSIAITLNKAH